MTDSEDMTDEERDNELYGVGIEPQGIPLPNFIDSRQTRVQSVIDAIEANIPQSLTYRAYIPMTRFTFGFKELDFTVCVDLAKKGEPITTRIENYELSRKLVDKIRVSLRESVAREIATNESELNLSGVAFIILRLLEETSGYIFEYRQMLAKSLRFDNDTISNFGQDLDSYYAQSSATEILGKSREQLCKEVQLDGWRILHVENILRKDLELRFLQYQSRLRHSLMNTDTRHLRKLVPHHLQRAGSGTAVQEQLVEYLTTPQVTFHGTRRDNVANVVQHGFIKPGDLNPTTKEPVQRANGLTYGLGIYSSPEPWYCLFYANRAEQRRSPFELPGIKIIVCATIMGRRKKLNNFDYCWSKTPAAGFDSHVDGTGLEWIVFNAAQILPCYVLHLDWADSTQSEIYDIVSKAADRAKHKHKKLDDEYLFPGDKQRQKQERLAQGRKFFAYGFGPVSGNKIVIEDIADVDDDEEEYGDYHQVKLLSETGPFAYDGELEEEGRLDQYNGARRAKNVRLNPRTLY